MFFNSKKYKKEVENSQQQNEDTKKLIFVGLLATNRLTRWLLRLHPHRHQNLAKVTKMPEQIPVLFYHGFRGGDHSTQVIVDHTSNKLKRGYCKLIVDLYGNITLTGEWSGKNPIVQVVFKHRILSTAGFDYCMKMVIKYLKDEFGIEQYKAVAHSLSAPCVVRVEMQVANKKKYPHLESCALIAGPFNGVTYLGDIPNVNAFTQNGRPIIMNHHYLYLLLHKKRFSPNIKVLNIYGNILNLTNTDNYISVISAKSIRYILAPVSREFHEIEIRGKDAEHSWLHDNPFVIDIITKFLKLC
ncbi:MAG: alpha/beta hydrolase [Lactobacillus sp.]|nr:alpha/beta hydrolase [Lactobacillus sp.]